MEFWSVDHLIARMPGQDPKQVEMTGHVWIERKRHEWSPLVNQWREAFNSECEEIKLAESDSMKLIESVDAFMALAAFFDAVGDSSLRAALDVWETKMVIRGRSPSKLQFHLLAAARVATMNGSRTWS